MASFADYCLRDGATSRTAQRKLLHFTNLADGAPILKSSSVRKMIHKAKQRRDVAHQHHQRRRPQVKASSLEFLLCALKQFQQSKLTIHQLDRRLFMAVSQVPSFLQDFYHGFCFETPAKQWFFARHSLKTTIHGKKSQLTPVVRPTR